MTKPNKEQLLEFVKNNDIELDPIIDDESALRHFKRQRDQYKRERDSLIKKVEKLRERNKKLEYKNDDYHMQLDEADYVVKRLKYKYTNLTQHIRNKAENNPSVSRYKNLVEYIDDLEADTHEG